MLSKQLLSFVGVILYFVGVCAIPTTSTNTTNSNWQRTASGPWAAREGLMGVSLGDYMYISGGRGTFGVAFEKDVWRSTNGSSWVQVGSGGPFPGRAYHNMVVKDDCMFIFGGQTFTTFYNDVWRSCDAGVSWTQLTAAAPWPVRAGAAATIHNGQIIMAGGCYQDGVTRKFRGDVWSSPDGLTWTQITPQAEWSARSGPRLISYQGKLLIIAGEVGFTNDTQIGDIWSSSDDGKSWDLVTKSPGFSARSGHGVVVSPSNNTIVMVAGWPELHDLWVSPDGKSWKQISDDVWSCTSEKCGKFDFWPLVHKGNLFTLGGSGAYSTFGKLYNEVWKYTAPWP